MTGQEDKGVDLLLSDGQALIVAAGLLFLSALAVSVTALALTKALGWIIPAVIFGLLWAGCVGLFIGAGLRAESEES